MWYCPKCGAQNNGKFCAKCGTANPVNQVPPNNGGGGYGAVARSMDGKMIGAIIAYVAGLICLLFLPFISIGMFEGSLIDALEDIFDAMFDNFWCFATVVTLISAVVSLILAAMGKKKAASISGSVTAIATLFIMFGFAIDGMDLDDAIEILDVGYWLSLAAFSIGLSLLQEKKR